MKPAKSFLLVLAVLLAVPLLADTAVRRHASSPTLPTKPTASMFTQHDLEAFQSDEILAWVRPGVKIVVNSVVIGSDRKPVVDYNLTDSLDQPIDRLGKLTPGAVSVSFILSWYDPATRQYTSYITRTETAAAPSTTPGVKATQAATDSGGKTVDLATGHATYTFGNALPANFDQTKTHTLGMYATRPITDPFVKTYYANAEFNFRPDGQKVTDTWDKINMAASCNNCHDPLSAHGGARRDVKLCVLCHQPQTVDADTGNTVDFKVMIHKIHDGANLPSVKGGKPYQIIGFGQSVVDFSTIVFPIGNEVTNCAFCHQGTDPKNVPAQSDVWFTKPSAVACGSCHDDVNFTTGANHPGGPQADDSACAKCHVPQGDLEFDASIKGAHTVPTKSAQLKGLKVSVVSATNLAPGKKPTVVLSVTNNDGSAVDGSKLDRFAPIIAGNTTNYDFAQVFRETPTAANPATFDPTTGNTSYTFNNAVPATASGTWTVSADVYRNVKLARGDSTTATVAVREAAMNPIFNVAVTGGLVPRRTVVQTQSCNVCHDQLGLHGGQRQNTQECVICHDPTLTAKVTSDPSGPQESVSFQRQIHRIHTGENLTQPYVIGSSNFNEVKFPGDTTDCAKCHTGNSFTLPLAQTNIASVATLRDYFSPQGPATVACLGCHDNRDAAAHAYLNTVTFPGSTVPAEACATCHGTGKDWDVARVHAK